MRRRRGTRDKISKLYSLTWNPISKLRFLSLPPAPRSRARAPSETCSPPSRPSPRASWPPPSVPSPPTAAPSPWHAPARPPIPKRPDRLLADPRTLIRSRSPAATRSSPRSPRRSSCATHPRSPRQRNARAPRVPPHPPPRLPSRPSARTSRNSWRRMGISAPRWSASRGTPRAPTTRCPRPAATAAVPSASKKNSRTAATPASTKPSPNSSPIHRKHPTISYADLFAYVGVVAIETMGGPKLKFSYGRVDEMDPSAVTPDGRLPNADVGDGPGPKERDHLRKIFGRMGFKDQEIVALSGAHALGRCHADASGYVGPWSGTPLCSTTATSSCSRV